jgi:hypothetical protein
MIAFEQAPELRVTGFDRETLATPRLVPRRVAEEAPAGAASREEREEEVES